MRSRVHRHGGETSLMYFNCRGVGQALAGLGRRARGCRGRKILPGRRLRGSASLSMMTTAKPTEPLPLPQAIDRYLDVLRVERGLSKNTLAAYASDLGRFYDFVAGYDAAVCAEVARLDTRHTLAFAVS